MVLGLAFLLLPLSIHGQKEGTPDEDFGVNSTFLSEKGEFWDAGSVVGLQSDGKILLAGTKDIWTPNSGMVGKAITYRLTTDGLPDLSFGENGSISVIDPENYYDKVVDMWVMEDNSFYLLVHSEDIDWPWYSPDYGNTTIIKFQPGGFPDSTFGINGRLVLDLTPIAEFTSAFRFQSDRFFLVGMCDTMPDAGAYLPTYAAALFEDGSLDTSYGMNGVRIIQPNSYIDHITGLAIKEDGKLILAGTLQDPFGNLDGYLLQFLPTGELDTDFGNNGYVVLDDVPNTSNTLFQDVALQGSNIVVAGHTRMKGNFFAPTTLLATYDASGKPDHSFGQSGIRIDTFSSTSNKVSQIEIGPNNEIYIGGQLRFFDIPENEYHDEVFIAKYDPNGIPDPQYGENGLFTGLSSSLILINDMILQPDGKQLIAGVINILDHGNKQLFIQRVNGNSSTSVQNASPTIPQLTVIPNVVRSGDKFRINYASEVEGSVSIQLLNPSGQIIMQVAAETIQDLQMTVPNVPGGLYLLNVRVGNDAFIEKIVILDR